MQQIITNLSDPAWWFNGIFFILVGLAVAWIFKKIPIVLKSALRKRLAKTLRKIKYERWCASSVQYQLNSSQARFFVFIFTCFTYISWLAYDPLKIIFNESFFLGMLLTSPIYIIEIYWLMQDQYVKELIKRRRKLRITSQ
ncbi:hypothetical protein ACFSJY_06355 [Thalassotalea euphylliae]|uniref:hypothetical protein n=1 Tax=Thalassotalea euphylliae TaxID=1655234 RepID=UPI003631B671